MTLDWNRVRRELTSFGLELRGVPFGELTDGSEAPGDLVRMSEVQPVQVWLPRRGEASLATRASSGRPLLVIADRIHARTAQQLRDADVWFVDSAGNAFIAFGGVFVDVRGRRPEAVGEVDAGDTARDVNLFSAKRAQVMFALLTWQELAAGSLRSIARAAGVSVGQAQQTMKLLEELGEMSGRNLTDPRKLFDTWVRLYPSGLAKSLRLKEFHGELDQLQVGGLPLWLSGAAAVPEVMRAEDLTLYIDHSDGMLYTRNRWRTDREPNVFVRRKFWSVPGEVSAGGSPKVRPVPSTLIYADLMASGDSRQKEAAQWLKERDDRLRAL